ncbi:long-chain-fatty-acid--CoA ligase [Gordonia asplenii]
MMNDQLSITDVLEHGQRWNAQREVITKTADGWRTASFAAVAENAARLANALQSLGIDGDQRVGTFMWNNQEHLEAYLAVPAMGAVLHTANMRLTPEQVAYTINAADDRVMIVDASLAELFVKVLPLLTSVHTIIVNGSVEATVFADADITVLDYHTLVDAASPQRVWTIGDERNAASICFTTGTTGNPKGVAYSHRSIVLQCLGTSTIDTLGIGNRDRMLVLVPMFHATAWCYPYTGFWSGADIVLLDEFLSPAAIIDAIQTFGITFANGVPTVWNDVLRILRAEPHHNLSSLQRVVIGGAAATTALFDGFDEVGVRIVQGWGMTETSPLVTVGRDSRGVDATTAASQRLSQGRVLAGVRIRVVDPDSGDPLPDDGRSVGELELRGPWIAGGYLGDEGSDKFHDGWLRTGDVGTIDDQGFVRLTDRAKDIIKSGGEWISSVDLENVLVAHPSIRDVTVIGVPDARWDERPCAIVVFEDGRDVDVEELRVWLVGRVARFWVPENWITTTALPRTSVGKIDKKDLRSRHAAGEFEMHRSTSKLPSEA